MIAVEFNSIKKKYRNNEVLRDITFKINQNEFTILFGEPGCGKSVILRLLTGIEKPDSGYIKIRGHSYSVQLSTPSDNPMKKATINYTSTFDELLFVINGKEIKDSINYLKEWAENQ